MKRNQRFHLLPTSPIENLKHCLFSGNIKRLEIQSRKLA